MRPLFVLPLFLAACSSAAPERPPVAAAMPAAPAAIAPPAFAPQRTENQPADPLQVGEDGHRSVVLGALVADEPPIGPILGLDLADVQAEVLRNAGTLQRCYEERLQTVPDLAGTIGIHAHITPSGRVEGQCITDDRLSDPVMVACVNTLIAMGRYPTGHGQTVDVTFPFVFTPVPRG